LILDPKTPLDQAIQLATAAAKTAAAAKAIAAEAPSAQEISRPLQQQQPEWQPEWPQQQQQQQREGVRSSITLKRQAGEAAVTAAATAATAAVGAATAAAAGVQEDIGFAGFASMTKRDGPEPPAHLTCPITNEVGKPTISLAYGLLYLMGPTLLCAMKGSSAAGLSSATANLP
jgi:hypothetical protein